MLSLVGSNLLVHCLETGLNLIYQEKYLTFSNAFRPANMKSLKMRDVESITKFIKMAFKSEDHKHWFCKSEESVGMATRRRQGHVLKPVKCMTQRYSRSSIPVMMNLLNWHPPLP